MTGGLGGVHGLHDLGGHMVALGVHDVLGGIVLLHKAERVDAHLELDGRPAAALVFDALDELLREMQARSGRGSGVLLAHGVHGLVLLGIALIAGDVGRQRHVARGVNRLIQRALNPLLVHAHGPESHQAPALGVIHEIDDLGFEHHG